MEDKLKKEILDEILDEIKSFTRSISTDRLNFDFASLYPNIVKVFSMDGDIKKSNRIKKIKNIFNVLH